MEIKTQENSDQLLHGPLPVVGYQRLIILYNNMCFAIHT